MNKLFFFVVWFCTFSTSSQVVSIPSNQKAKDMVYDAITDKIYITIPATDAVNGNSIGIVNPYTNTLESTLFVGNSPVELAISDNGQYIYVALDGTPKVRRYTLNPLAFDMEFGLGSYPENQGGYGSFYAIDIAVMPGQPGTVAVSRRYDTNIVVPGIIGIGIYDNGVMRPTDYRPPGSGLGIKKIKFKDASILIGHAGNNIPSNTAYFNINTNGISLGQNFQDMPNPHPYGTVSDFVYRQNKLYFMNGKRIDVSSTPYIIDGQYTPNLFAGGGVMYDELNNLLCFGDSGGTYTFYQGGFWDGYLKRYNPTTFQLFDSNQITTAGDVDKMISCGNNCYALITYTYFTSGTNRLVIVRPQVLNNDAFTFDNNFKLYPNPTLGLVYLQSKNPIDITNISIYNNMGSRVSNNPNNNEIDLSTFSNGIYFCKITDNKGNTFTKKIIKK
jgi:hypothetical protein